jgi:hypothetical protein
MLLFLLIHVIILGGSIEIDVTEETVIAFLEPFDCVFEITDTE